MRWEKISKDRLQEAIGFCRKACELRPENPRYEYILSFSQPQHGDTFEAIRMLKILTQNNPGDADAAQLLKQLPGGD